MHLRMTTDATFKGPKGRMHGFVYPLPPRSTAWQRFCRALLEMFE